MSDQLPIVCWIFLFHFLKLRSIFLVIRHFIKSQGFLRDIIKGFGHPSFSTFGSVLEGLKSFEIKQYCLNFLLMWSFVLPLHPAFHIFKMEHTVSVEDFIKIEDKYFYYFLSICTILPSSHSLYFCFECIYCASLFCCGYSYHFLLWVFIF